MISPPLQHGFFLALEGVDGAGKSTQVKQLADWLRSQGYGVTTCRDPGGTPAGDRIRQVLLERSTGAISPITETFLFMASRAQLVEEVIRPAMLRREVVISDRFVLSTVVYQGYAGNLDPQMCWELGRIATQNTLPDLTLVLDMPVAEVLARRHGPQDRMEDKGQAFLEQVRTGFLTEVAKHSMNHRLVDATPAVEVVHHALQQEVSHALERHLRPR
ncbi:MAG TPA: dTMP kinase [Gemmatales bacterium]|nr:dTMP kinase [Gemmatales bacterium]